MSLRLRSDSFSEFLTNQSDVTLQTPKATPEGMCILSGQILRRNLKEYLNRQNIPTSPLAHFTTIEELASDLLRPTSKPSGILEEGVRDRLIEDLLHAADPANEAYTLDDTGSTERLRTDERDAIRWLSVQLPYDEEEPRERLRDELDDYLRWTDATRDTASAMSAIGSLESQFAQKQSLRATDAFRGIVRLIDERLEELPVENQQSRSHLVTAARSVVGSQWSAQFADVEWIAVAGITVFDSPTLRFLEAIAEDPSAPTVHVFVNAGSFEYNANRIRELETGIVSSNLEDSDSLMKSSIAQALFDATQGNAVEVPEADFIEAPTDQRAVERVANDVRELLQEGESPHDILLVAPDAGSYQSLMQNAFETLGIPLFVETRQPVSDIPAYRCFRTLVEVIESVANDEPMQYGTIVDPLRLGYCEPGAHGSRWPIKGREFTKIEQELHRKQRYYNQTHDRYEDQGLLFDNWRTIIDEIPGFTADWDAVTTYLGTIEKLAETPPSDGDAIRNTFSSYLGTYVHQTVEHRRSLYEAPGINTTRTAITETHATSLAEIVRNKLDAVGTHYDRMQDLFDAKPSWHEVGRSFSTALGGDSFGESHLDGQAVPLVDAGNAFFRDAEHLFVIGMNAEEFPGKSDTPTFLHTDLRQTVYKSANHGKSPYPHLDNRATAYGEALDFYQASLRAAESDASVTLVHTYQDEQGNDIAWSSFVDLFDIEGEGDTASPLVDRVSVGEWLPQPRSNGNEIAESWDEVIGRTSPRERLRMLLYQANRDHPKNEPAISNNELETMASTINPKLMNEEIQPRIDRYQSPPREVTIEANEPAFDKIGFETVAGIPLRPHELDLNGQCELKYYYYQLLYNFEGDNPERDRIPTYYSQAPHYRLGELPLIVRENYADPRYVEKWRRLVTELLPVRQSTTSGLAQFNSTDELRTWLLDQDGFEEYDLNTVFKNLVAERQLVEQELKNGVTREWDWRTRDDIEINGYGLSVPPYRLDTVSDNGSEYTVPIFFTRFSNRANSALKNCRSAIWKADEATRSICLECDSYDSCGYNSKYVVDHRMLAGYEHETEMYNNNVAGIGLQEQYAGPDDGERVVAIRQGIVDKFHPFESEDVFEKLIGRGYSEVWDNKATTWRENFLTQANQLDSKTPITLDANMDLVNQDECLNCVYRDLCAVPIRGDRK
jgi:ATP-dependent helicase/nuclease subunit B